MKKNYILAILLTCLVNSCSLLPERKKLAVDELPGAWLVLYPDHKLMNRPQRVAYGKIQDSIVGLSGLKMIYFNKNGSFFQADSLFARRGAWMVSENEQLLITDAGAGFDAFRGELLNLTHDTLRIIEELTSGVEKLKMVWHLKRIPVKQAANFFEEEENTWRRRPGSEASLPELEKKIKTILEYYSNYFQMVSKESAYFLPNRVLLPFSYYQHALGLKSFEADSDFANLFYNGNEARRAYRIIQMAMETVKNRPFPSGENFVIEYAGFMKQLAEAI